MIVRYAAEACSLKVLGGGGGAGGGIVISGYDVVFSFGI